MNDDDDEVLLCVHRNHRLIRDGSPGGFHTAPELCVNDKKTQPINQAQAVWKGLLSLVRGSVAWKYDDTNKSFQKWL